jgi:hypothetical protein
MRKEPRKAAAPLVTEGPGLRRKRRCGLLSVQDRRKGSKFLFIEDLHKKRDEVRDGITSFSVLRSQYFAFFGQPPTTTSMIEATASEDPRLQDPPID